MKDYKKLGSELIVAIRGSKSEEVCAQHIGVSVLRYQRLEEGMFGIRWTDFVKLCNLSEINLKRSIRATVGSAINHTNGCDVIRYALSEMSIVEVSKTLDVPRTTFLRWMKEDGGADLSHVLHAMDYTHRLGIFTDLISAETKQDVNTPSQVMAESVQQNFDLLFISAAVGVDEYRKLPEHVSGVLSKIAGTDPADEVYLLEQLAKLGGVELRDGKYRQTMESFQVPGHERLGETMASKTKELFMRLKKPRENSMGAYQVCSVSQEDYKKINAILLKSYREVSEILETPTGTIDRVMYFTTALFDVREITEMEMSPKASS